MISAFCLGAFEFCSDVTTNCVEQSAYDWGREIAHRLTMRLFEHS